MKEVPGPIFDMPWCFRGSQGYLEGHGDLVSRLIMGMIGVTAWVILNLLSPQEPPSRV